MSEEPGGLPELSREELGELESIFDDVVHVPPRARAAILADRCAGRPELRAEVEALLDSHDQLGDFLNAPDRAVIAVPENDDAVSASDRMGVGSTVGPYRLVEHIGEGGMGNVYLAERADGLFRHRVAIKVTHSSARGGDAARRFRAERQILASLQHPNIVTLLDGGVTPAGEAYLVMEHVAGVPITAHCQAHGLPLEARLQLVRQVAGAVQFAHQHGIVHRDLKPGNILVTGDGIVKVLDFGVAKLLEAPAGADRTITRTFPGPLTPNYASPEQLRGLPTTTASDVYALGVVTYEIVTGTRPYETSGKTLDDVLEMVLETEPTRPSAIRSGDDTRARPPYPHARLKGDLDAVVLKAMSKPAERRYGSAGELADDLERFLTGRPVVAREPSIGYLLRRMAARNRAAVAIAAAAVVAILAALGVALWQRSAAVQAQTRAERRFTETRQLANTLIFKIHDAIVPLAGSTPVRQMIVTEALAYLERLEAESEGDESLDLELSRAYRQIGFIQGNPNTANLGNREEALKQYEKARRLALPLGLKSDASAGAISNLVSVDMAIADLVKRRSGIEAGAVFTQEAVEQAQRVVRISASSRDSRSLLGRALFAQAILYNPGAASIPHWERAKDHYEQDLAAHPDDREYQRNVALVCRYLGGVLETMGDYPASLKLQRRALELDERRYLADPGNRTTQFDFAVSLSSVATAMEHAGKDDEAAALYSRSLDIRQGLSDSDPKDVLALSKTGYVKMRLALVEIELGHGERARELAQSSVAIQEEVVQKTKEQNALS